MILTDDRIRIMELAVKAATPGIGLAPLEGIAKVYKKMIELVEGRDD